MGWGGVMYGSVGLGVGAVAGIVGPWSFRATDAAQSSERMARNA